MVGAWALRPEKVGADVGLIGDRVAPPAIMTPPLWHRVEAPGRIGCRCRGGHGAALDPDSNRRTATQPQTPAPCPTRRLWLAKAIRPKSLAALVFVAIVPSVVAYLYGVRARGSHAALCLRHATVENDPIQPASVGAQADGAPSIARAVDAGPRQPWPMCFCPTYNNGLAVLLSFVDRYSAHKQPAGPEAGRVGGWQMEVVSGGRVIILWRTILCIGSAGLFTRWCRIPRYRRG